MTKFTYPKGMIPMTGGFRKNDPTDDYPMGVAKDMFGGFQVVSTVDDMLNIHPNYLIPGFTACLVTLGTGNMVELYYLKQAPSNADGTIIEDWYKSQLGISGGGLSYKGKFDPTDYTLTDVNDQNISGDLYIVNTPTSVDITDPTLFGGVTTSVKNTDWIVFNGVQFEHISQMDLSLITWETLTGKPQVIKDLLNGILPAHNHNGDGVEISQQVGSKVYTTLTDLLSVIVYSNSIATSITDAQSNQLLTLEQLEKKYVSQDELSTSIGELMGTELVKYYSKDEIDTQLAAKQDNLSDSDIKNKLESNEDTNTLTDVEYEKLKNLQENGAGAKIVLHDVVALDGGIISKVNKSDIPGESYITEISSTGTSVRCTFRFSTMASLYGAFLVNGETFDSVSRVGTSEIFEAVKDIDLTGLTQVKVTGDSNLNITVNQADDMITQSTLPAMEAPKTHYYKGEIIPVTVGVSDLNVNYIQIVNGNGIKNTEKLPVVISEGQCSVNLEITHEGEADVASCVLIPYIDNILGSSFSVTGIPVDNTTPSITDISISYSNGYSALKDVETADINIIGSNYDSLVISNIDNTYLQAESVALNKVIVSRVSGDDLTSEVELTVKKDSNQKEYTETTSITIYNILPSLIVDLQNIKSGIMNSLDVTLDTDKLNSLTNPSASVGLLSIDGVELNYEVDDTVAHDGASIDLVFDLITIAGKVQNGASIPVKITGFAERTLTLNYPDFEFALPFDIIEPNNIIMSGIINSSPSFEISEFEWEGGDVDGFVVENNNTIKLKTELEAFGYNESNTLTIKIQE